MPLSDIYCRDVLCPGYGTPKANHHGDAVQRRSDGGKADLPATKDGKPKTDGPNRDESTSDRVPRHG